MCISARRKDQGTSWLSSGQDFALTLLRILVRSLVGELRSVKLCGEAGKKDWRTFITTVSWCIHFENSLAFSNKSDSVHTLSLSGLLPDIYPRTSSIGAPIYICKGICGDLVLATDWKQPKYPSTVSGHLHYGAVMG